MRCAKENCVKIARLVEERGGHGAPIQFTGSPGIYQYHNENNLVKEMKCDLFPVRRFPAKTIENWLKVNEIESLKTEKSPGIILEKSWNFVFMFLYEPCMRRSDGFSRWRILQASGQPYGSYGVLTVYVLWILLKCEQ